LEIGITYYVYPDFLNRYLNFVHHNGKDVIGAWPYLHENGTSDTYYNLESPIAADINNDNCPELISWRCDKTSMNSFIVALNSQGNKINNWPFYIKTDPSCTSGLVGDINDDGYPDIIMPTGPNWRAGDAERKIFLLDKDGKEIAQPLLLPDSYSAATVGATMGDIDNDGKIEVVAVTIDGTIVAWDLDGRYNATTMKWPTYRHDNYLTGCYIELESPPFPPSNLAAKVVSSTQIDLNWKDNSNNETGFKIERSPNPNSH